MKSNIFFFIAMIIFFLCTSCEVKAPKIKLNRGDRTHVDSLYKSQLSALEQEMDSLCEVFRETKYQLLKDSITSLRLAEIEQIAPE